jgi:hypothetical protein
MEAMQKASDRNGGAAAETWNLLCTNTEDYQQQGFFERALKMQPRVMALLGKQAEDIFKLNTKRDVK